MKNLQLAFRNMKYRHKLTILLVIASLVPMTVLVLYTHIRISGMIRENEVEDMNFTLVQTREGIDSQIAVYSSLLNYLTYSPEIEELIANKNLDGYAAYETYTEVADPLLSVPKSYHDAITQIQLFADSIKVEHEYTLVPLGDIGLEWWYSELDENQVQAQWLVNQELKEIAGVRKIYDGQNLEAVLCVTLDYDRIFEPFLNILVQETGGMIVDEEGNILLHQSNLESIDPSAEKNAEEILAEVGKFCSCVSSVSAESGWSFYFYRSNETISMAMSQLVVEEIPLILACIIIIFLLGLSFSRLFTRKIEQLTANMDQVNRGSREVTVFSDSEDEIGVLVKSFRRMMDEINRLIDEVYVNKIALKEFELKALQAQINPHFLYNTLSSINWMAIRSEQKEISHVTLALSTFYRTALSKGEDMVTVENCIRNIEAYLEIQLVMHDHDFKVEWDIDPEIKNEKVPKLLLQPVVENALEHGLDLKEDGEKILKLGFLQVNEEIWMTVEDNGQGMEQAKAESLVTYQAKGYGLKNVNDRICLLYGDEYAIRIFSEEGKGTKVIMRIPKGVKLDEREKKL